MPTPPTATPTSCILPSWYSLRRRAISSPSTMPRPAATRCSRSIWRRSRRAGSASPSTCGEWPTTWRHTLISTNPTADPLATAQIATVAAAAPATVERNLAETERSAAAHEDYPVPHHRPEITELNNNPPVPLGGGSASQETAALHQAPPSVGAQAYLLGDRLRVGGGRAHSCRGAGGGHRPLAAGHVRAVGGRRELGRALRAGPLRHPAHGGRAGRRVPAGTGGALGYRTLCSAPGQVASRWPKT